MAASPSPAPLAATDDQPDHLPVSSASAQNSSASITSNGAASDGSSASAHPAPSPSSQSSTRAPSAAGPGQGDRSHFGYDTQAEQEATRRAKPTSRFAFGSTVPPAGAAGDDAGAPPKPVRRLNPDHRPGPPSSLTPAQPAPPATSTGTSAASSASSAQQSMLSPHGQQQQQQQHHPQQQAGAVFPALHLTPLNGTFVPKQISLDPPGTRVKIGRQTNAKSIPNGTNGYFDSKVLSRAHAEVWSEDGRVFIKDVKSSNGTFINGERLSPESSESDVFELHTDDVVEFGIDILTDDTKTIVHHKVAAKVHLVLNAEDAIASSREINNWYRSAGEQNLGRVQRVPRAPAAQNGLSFEHVLSRLQGELQKSRDTGVNLGDVNSTLTVVHDTLGGGAPPPLSPHLAGGPRSSAAFPPRADVHAQSIAALQQQLGETQQSLHGHIGKIRDLEGLLAEHDTIKREVGSLRAQMEEARESMSAMIRERELELEERHRARARRTNGRESPLAALLAGEQDPEDLEESDEPQDMDDDDAASVASVETVSLATVARGVNGLQTKTHGVAMPQDAPEADEDEAAPPALSDAEVDLTGGSATVSTTTLGGVANDTARERLLQEQNAKLVSRLEALSAELDEATSLGAALRSQHAAASETIRALEARVASLEAAVDRRVAEAEGRVEQRWEVWRERFEQSWRDERASWANERDKLRELVQQWEERRSRDVAKTSSSSNEEDDEDAEGSSSGSDGDNAGKLLPSGLSPSDAAIGAGSRKKRSPRRRKRSSLTPVPPNPPSSSSSTPSISATTAQSPSVPLTRSARLAHSLKSRGAEVTSDSDSTIGELGGRWGAGKAAGEDRDVQDDVRAGPSRPLPLSLGAAVVVLAVAVGYGAAMKLKE